MIYISIITSIILECLIYSSIWWSSSLDNEDIYYYNDYNIDDYEDNLLSHEIILILLI